MKHISITSFGTDHGKSGIGSYLKNLLPWFDKSHEFSFTLIGPPQDAAIYLKDTKHIEFVPVSDRWDPAVPSYFWHQYRLPGLCRRLSCDLLFLPAANRRLTSRASCPTIGTVHDLASLHIAEKYDFMHRYFNRSMLPKLIADLDAVITVSEFSKNDILRFTKTAEENIRVIHLAADLRDFHPITGGSPAERLQERYGIVRPYILYTSRIEHPGKNHVTLIKAFNLLKKNDNIPHMLVFAGPDKERAEAVHREAAASSYSEDIVFTGFADVEDIPLLYSGADLFVLPSRFEGFGLPVLEAMASEIPVLCSNAASLPEVCGGHAVLFHPDKPEELAEKAAELLQLPDSGRELMTSKASAWAHSFSWERTAERTFELFRELVL